MRAGHRRASQAYVETENTCGFPRSTGIARNWSIQPNRRAKGPCSPVRDHPLVSQPDEQPQRVVVGSVVSGSVEVRRGAVEAAIDGVLQSGAQIEPPAERRIAIGKG